MITNEIPIRTEAACLMRGGLRNRAGSLLLYPNRMVHVGSRVAQVGGGFGLIGVLVTRAVANAQAAGKAAGGGKNVVTIPFGAIMEIEGRKLKLGGRAIVVRTVAGDEYRFGGVKLDRWSDDLQRLLRDNGRTVASSDNGLSVS